MNFTLLDWFAIVVYLGITLLVGLYFRRRSGRSVDDYFVSGRKVHWFLAGTSMVATTFAADTPLWVAGRVYEQGISGNWLWWSFLPSGMMTVFLFARLWRRSGVLTDVQFTELRYGGKPAAFLRGFRSLYLGLLMNCIILGWVTKAMASILATSAGVSDTTALLICVLFLIPFTGIYVSLGGLWGVLWTDLFQFVMMMGIVIAVAWYAVDAAGGMSVMLGKLHAMHQANPNASDPTALFPNFGLGLTGQAMWTIPVLVFLVHLAVQWWAFWYPGAEPGGGGYIAQRIFSARDERHGLLSVLWFNIAHYAVRPWPWIITALAAIVLYPGLTSPEQMEKSYMVEVSEHLPPALRGLVVAGFLAAFMSTVATQLNWGSSYVVSDFYRRFLRPDRTERHYVHVGRLVTLLIVVLAGIVSALLASIASGWQVVLEIGAGTGTVYLLRWYWWRINAWSEISAMATAMLAFISVRLFIGFEGSAPVVFAKNVLFTTAMTTIVWLVVTFVTRPERQEVLLNFFRKVRPDVRGWQPVAKLAPDVPQNRDLGSNLIAWLLGVGMVYFALFGFGKLLLQQPGLGSLLMLGAVVCAALLYTTQSKRGWGAEAATSAAE